MTFHITGINHIGIAPGDMAKARWFFGEVLNLPYLGDETVEAQQTRTSVYRGCSQKASSEGRLELLAPATAGEGPIAKYLTKRKSGIHHLALSVTDIESAIAHLREHDVRMIDETARDGVHNTKIAFIHPESTGGILVEVVQQKTGSR